MIKKHFFKWMLYESPGYARRIVRFCNDVYSRSNVCKVMILLNLDFHASVCNQHKSVFKDIVEEGYSEIWMLQIKVVLDGGGGSILIGDILLFGTFKQFSTNLCTVWWEDYRWNCNYLHRDLYRVRYHSVDAHSIFWLKF